MDMNPSWEATSYAVTQKFSQHFTEPEVSLPCYHDPSTSPYPEPDKSSSYRPMLSPSDPF
jgi:hypothetical protein